MFTWIAVALIVIGAGYGLYQMFAGSKSQSGDAFRRQNGLPSIFTDSRGKTPRADSALQSMAGGRVDGRGQGIHSNSAPASEPVSASLPVTPAVGTPAGYATTPEAGRPITSDKFSVTEHTLNANSENSQRLGSGRTLFPDFDGILHRSGQDNLKSPSPEELPMSSDDMVFGSVTPALAELLPEGSERRTQQRKNLTAAGYHSRSAWTNLTAIRFTLAFLALVITGFWLLMAPSQLELLLAGSVIFAPLLMWALPPLIVSHQASERQIDIERGLPDVLDMLNMGVSQGLTVPAALRRITTETAAAHPALSQELSIVCQQANVGTLGQALRAFSQRIDSPEVSSFTSLLMQSETTGTSISQALRDYSDSMRSSLRERADTRANSAAFKLLFPTTLCLMPSVFLFLLGPAIVDMTNFFDNTAGTLTQNRTQAVRTLDLQPVVVPIQQDQ